MVDSTTHSWYKDGLISQLESLPAMPHIDAQIDKSMTDVIYIVCHKDTSVRMYHHIWYQCYTVSNLILGPSILHEFSCHSCEKSTKQVLLLECTITSSINAIPVSNLILGPSILNHQMS